MYYILKGREAVPVKDVLTWAKYFETADRHVDKTYVGEVYISTAFLGMDHQWGEGPPLIFETMIFNGEHDGYEDRYSTWEEAEKGHEKAVELVKKSITK